MRESASNPKAGSADVAAEVEAHLEGIADPWGRYLAAGAEQARHEAAAAALQRVRDKALAALNAGLDGAPRHTYERLAEMTGLSRSGAQKAVERGRAASDPHTPMRPARLPRDEGRRAEGAQAR